MEIRMRKPSARRHGNVMRSESISFLVTRSKMLAFVVRNFAILNYSFSLLMSGSMKERSTRCRRACRLCCTRRSWAAAVRARCPGRPLTGPTRTHSCAPWPCGPSRSTLAAWPPWSSLASGSCTRNTPKKRKGRTAGPRRRAGRRTPTSSTSTFTCGPTH